jgi:hypothetical protein
MAADRPAHLGVGDGVGAAIVAAEGEAVGDGVGSAVGLSPKQQNPSRAHASRRVARARMAADRPAHLGVGDGVGAAVVAAEGKAVGDGVGSAVGLSTKQQSPYPCKCDSTCCRQTVAPQCRRWSGCGRRGRRRRARRRWSRIRRRAESKTANPLHKHMHLDVLNVARAHMAEDRPAHLGVGDGVGAAVVAAVGEPVGDGVGSAVGLSTKQQSPYPFKCDSTCCTLHEHTWRRIDQRTSASAMEWVRPSGPPSARPSTMESDPPSG